MASVRDTGDTRPGRTGGRAASAPVRRPLSPPKIAAAALIGNLIEIYDFILYAFVAATVFGELFFPISTPWIATLTAISSAAVAFVMRPLGALLFGLVGDRWGRKRAVMLTLGLMGVATMGVGALPTYAAIGALAPVVLVLLRMVQGLAYGGEWGGAILIAVEHVPERRKTLYGAIPQVGAVLGLGLAAASLLVARTTVDAETFQQWGWRVPFLFGFLLIVIGLIIRRRLEETPEFVAAARRAEASPQARATLGTTLAEAGRSVVGLILVWLAAAVAVYTLLTGLLAYVPEFVAGGTALDVQIGLLLCTPLLVLYTIGGALLGQRIGRAPVLLIVGGLTAVWAFPAFWLIDSGSAVLLWVAMAVGMLGWGLTNGVVGAYMAEHFPVRLRYTGVSFSFAISSVLGGAVLPIPALYFVERMGGSSLPLALVLAVSGLATVAGVLLLRGQRAYRAEDHAGT